MAKPLLVSIVDDDEFVREALPDLLKELGYSAQAFSSAEEFLASDFVGLTRCLILDLSMPGMSGPDLQRELALRRRQIWNPSSSPLTEMRRSGGGSSNKARRSAFSSHLVI